ncbi:MAG: tripartite tricarboxylate transporter substrate binding protein [Acetobacteraceae bacterium]|nr:tripartite tricarboxylate transporter substrate binding protein [Acetobacteraceae bacterium]
MHRRSMLAAGLALAAPSVARAQAAWPERPVTVVNPFAPGGFTDGFGRGILQHVQRALGQPFVLDYRPGAGATLGALSVIRAAPDGHTLLYSPTTAWVISPWLRGAVYDPTTAFSPVIEVAATPMVLTARPGGPFRDVAALVAAARARPGTITYASAGAGSLPHLMGSFFAALAGVQLNHVPYRGGAPAMNDLLAGHVELMFEAIPNVAQHVATRGLVPLMISGGARSPLLPETPTMQEAGFPDLDLTSWIGLAGPAGLPAAIVATLNGAMNAALAAEDTRATMARLGMAPLGGEPARMTARIARESALYRRIIEQGGITVE